jgi:hypothetical protein
VLGTALEAAGDTSLPVDAVTLGAGAELGALGVGPASVPTGAVACADTAALAGGFVG